MTHQTPPTERPIDLARGTRDWPPDAFARLAHWEDLLLDRFARAGYQRLRTPVLEPSELHERKSGAGIVSKLMSVTNGHRDDLCLRPELTASIVRAYTAAKPAPALPWRVSASGPVFRQEKGPSADRAREFTQVGVELLGAPGPAADAEVIWLADWSLREAGATDATVRIGHVGLVLEVLDRSGLPDVAKAAFVEMLSEAAADGQDVRSLESALDRLSGWLRAGQGTPPEQAPPLDADERGLDRLFRQLVPDVTGRREGHEVLGRLRRKWDLAHTLQNVLDRVRGHLQELADLKGPAPAVLARLETWYRALAPDSVAALRALVDLLGHHGVAPERVELDLGFGRGIGFYSQMIFELLVPGADGPVAVAGGGRYDGLARVLGSDRDSHGVGFAFGLERLASAMEDAAADVVPPPSATLLVADSPESLPHALRLAVALRAEGLVVEMFLNPGQPNSKEVDVAGYSLQERHGAFLVVGTPGEPDALFLSQPGADGPERRVAPEELVGLLRSNGRGRPR